MIGVRSKNLIRIRKNTFSSQLLCCFWILTKTIISVDSTLSTVAVFHSGLTHIIHSIKELGFGFSDDRALIICYGLLQGLAAMIHRIRTKKNWVKEKEEQEGKRDEEQNRW
jgi:hypothetical protein